MEIEVKNLHDGKNMEKVEMVVLDLISFLGSFASIAGEARQHLEKNKTPAVTPPDYSRIPSDLQRNAEAVDQFISNRAVNPIIPEDERRQVYDEFYKQYPEFRYNHDFTDTLLKQAIDQLETYLQEKMTPGERVVKSDIDEMKSMLLSLKEEVADIKQSNVNIVNNFQTQQKINNINVTTHPVAVIVRESVEKIVENLQLGATGKDIDYAAISFRVTSPAEKKLHLESIGNDHGLRFVIDYSLTDNKMTLNYQFAGKSSDELLKNAKFIKNVVDAGEFAFYNDGKIVIGPIPTNLLFQYTLAEAENILHFTQNLVLIESFYSIRFNMGEDFDQEDQEWVSILAESIHGKSSSFTWTNASFTGVLRPAKEGMSVSEAVGSSKNLLKYGYTSIGDLTIGSTKIGEIRVKYELDSALIENVDEIQAELNQEPFREEVPVTVKLIPGDSNKGTRKVIFD